MQLISKAPQSSSSSRDVGRRLAVDIAGNAVSDQPLVGEPSPSSLLAIYPNEDTVESSYRTDNQVYGDGEDNGSDESYQSSPDPRIWIFNKQFHKLAIQEILPNFLLRMNIFMMLLIQIQIMNHQHHHKHHHHLRSFNKQFRKVSIEVILIKNLMR